MLALLAEHYKDIALAILAVAEIIAIFVPGAQGTVKTIATALAQFGIKKQG